jgi:hypothetical protein
MLGRNEPPLAGVEVCIVTEDGTVDTDYECVTTDAQGAFDLGPLPANTELIVAFSMGGYLTQIKPLDVAEASITLPIPFRMAANGDGGLPSNFGWDPAVVIDMANGTVNFFAVTSHIGDGGGSAAPGFDWVEGVSVTITPAGEGPFYIDGDERYDATLDATGNGGYGGWFMNLAPGEHVLTFSHPTLNCAPIGGNAFGWPEGPNSVRAPVVAGMNTQAVGVFCTAPVDGG